MLITSKFQSWCRQCGRVEINVGARCEWTPGIKGVMCLACLGANPPSAPPPKSTPRAHVDAAPREVAHTPELPPARAAMKFLETQFVRMAARSTTPAIDAAWTKYEKVKALAVGSRVKPEQRVALKTALVLLVTTIFDEESSYV